MKLFGFLACLTLTLVVLKIIGELSWGWIWVLTPLWGPVALAIGAFSIFISFFVAIFLSLAFSSIIAAASQHVRDRDSH